jgi:phenylalanyl-tRNA synthetase beta chain
VVEALLDDLHVPNVQYRPSSVPYLHPGKAAEVQAGGKSLGSFGQLHPRVAEQYGLGERTILVGEFDLEALQAVLPLRYTYTPVPKFPAALRDIAVVVDNAIPNERVEAELRTAGGDLLRGMRLFDVYRGKGIPDGAKSLAYALAYQAEDRTLTDKEVDKAHKKIEDRLRHVLKAQIRGKE